MIIEDPHIVIANLMAFRLARVEAPTPVRMASEAQIAGEMLFYAEKDGVPLWLELKRKHRDAEKKANKPPLPEKKLSSSSAASYSSGDTQ